MRGFTLKHHNEYKHVAVSLRSLCWLLSSNLSQHACLSHSRSQQSEQNTTLYRVKEWFAFHINSLPVTAIPLIFCGTAIFLSHFYALYIQRRKSALNKSKHIHAHQILKFSPCPRFYPCLLKTQKARPEGVSKCYLTFMGKSRLLSLCNAYRLKDTK